MIGNQWLKIYFVDFQKEGIVKTIKLLDLVLI
jgi:hypothetical protein